MSNRMIENEMDREIEEGTKWINRICEVIRFIKNCEKVLKVSAEI